MSSSSVEVSLSIPPKKNFRHCGDGFRRRRGRSSIPVPIGFQFPSTSAPFRRRYSNDLPPPPLKRRPPPLRRRRRRRQQNRRRLILRLPKQQQQQQRLPTPHLKIRLPHTFIRQTLAPPRLPTPPRLQPPPPPPPPPTHLPLLLLRSYPSPSKSCKLESNPPTLPPPPQRLPKGLHPPIAGHHHHRLRRRKRSPRLGCSGTGGNSA